MFVYIDRRFGGAHYFRHHGHRRSVFTRIRGATFQNAAILIRTVVCTYTNIYENKWRCGCAGDHRQAHHHRPISIGATVVLVLSNVETSCYSYLWHNVHILSIKFNPHPSCLPIWERNL